MKTTLTLIPAGLLLLAPMARAQDADVQKLIAESAAAYRSANALSMVMETSRGGGPTAMAMKTTLTVQRPNKLAAEIQMGPNVAHVVADGTNVYSDSSAEKGKYLKQPASDLTSALNELQRNRGTGVGLLPILLAQPAAETRMIPGKPTSAKHTADETVDGVPCDTIAAVVGEPDRAVTFRFAIAKSDHLLRRLMVTQGTAETPMMTESYTKVTTAPAITPALFTYTPAAGATLGELPKEPSMFDPRLKVGAAPFALTGKDLAGKPVTLAEYKGKVVLLDFWATWCGPCVAELPNVIAAYNKYHAKGFEIVGISLDRDTDKAKLEGFIKEHAMPWRQVYDGGYWNAANAKAYGVQAIPFTLLIGKDGKIVAVGARGPALAPAIEAALK